MMPCIRDFKNAWILATAFIIAGLSVIPGLHHVHYLLIEGKYISTCPVHLFALSGAFYIFGAVMYAKKLPEKAYPGKFDFFGNSHSIFHFCVVAGAMLAMWGSIRMFHER